MSASVRRRFLYTVAANLFRSLIGFVTGMLLARWLGPRDYGNMAFLLGTFLGIRQLLDMGTSSAFFTFLSQERQPRRFVQSYFALLAVQFLIPLIVIGLLFPDAWIETIWHGEQRGLVMLAFVAAFMQNSLWPVVQQAGESQRRTLRIQGIGVAVAGVHVAAVVALWAFGVLGLYAVFGAIAVEYVVASLVAHKGFEYGAASGFSSQEPLLRRYLRYCMPLVPYSWICFAYEFAYRWLLQNYGGSVQQAYYAVGAQFAGIALIATSSILRIFWKEIAEAHHQGNHARTGELYLKVSRILFLVGAVIAGFLIPWADALLQLILGAAYVGGAATLTIMFLYPVHQSMGQIGSTMLFATERIGLQVIIGIVFMVLSMAVTYLVLAPPTAALPGLGMASEGLALKMVGMQLLQVNVIAYIIARLWGWRFDWIYQPVGLIGCVGLGWLAHAAAVGLAGPTWPVVLVMGVAGVLYCALVALFVFGMPWLVGLSRREIVSELRHLQLMAASLLTPL